MQVYPLYSTTGSRNDVTTQDDQPKRLPGACLQAWQKYHIMGSADKTAGTRLDRFMFSRENTLTSPLPFHLNS